MTTSAASVTLRNKTYQVKGELPNGAFYLEGPKGGDVHYAKPVGNGEYMFFSARGGACVYEAGVPVVATKAELTA